MLNALGYYGIFLGMQYKNDLAMTKALDSDNYDREQVITLKVPVSIPYMPDQADFNKIEGKFEHQGQLYRIIKQRYAQDTLTIICVKDTEHEKIDRVLTDFVKTFTDKASDNKPTTKISFNFLKDYLTVPFSIRSLSIGWSAKVIINTNCGTLVPSFTASIEHPPERP
jgi:hypothetical protein